MAVFGALADWLIVVSIVLWFTYNYLTATYDYWKKRGVPFMQPIPIFGNSFKTLMNYKHSSFEQMDIYNQFPDKKYFGRFTFRKPVLVVRDPDLVETVLIKDFSHFYNRGIKVDVKLDRLSQHLVNLQDQQWKSLRNKLTPVFTSGKLKTMHQTLIDCSESLIEILGSFASSGEAFEAREVMGNFTTEVIGHCAFGLEMNALKNPNSEFRKMGREFFRPSFLSRLRLIVRQVYPKLLSLLQWKQVPENVEQFFINVIKETMAVREASGLEVHDFLQLLINLRREDQPLLDQRAAGQLDNTKFRNELLMDDTLMTSNALVFFLAGFETTASTLSFCLHELAQNPEIQEKLREEVCSVASEYNGVPNFEAIKEMPYLEQVILETLRKHPAVGAVPRECSKDWTIPGTNVTITKGTMVSIPIYSLQHDPTYYPDPDKFLPERFAEENKHNLRKGTFLPFGDGPRICIGNRFAKQEMKVALATMMLKCRFTTNSRTIVPLEFNPKSVFLVPKGGLWLNVERID